MIYSEEKLDKVMKLKITFDGKQNRFKVCSGKECYQVRQNPKTRGLMCQCWWFANRTVANPEKYGYCSHILGVMYNYDKKQFIKHISLIEQEK